MNYREVKASERLPDKTDGKNVSNYVHIFHAGGIVEAGEYNYDKGEWFDDEGRQLNKVEYWLEPIEPSKSAEEAATKNSEFWLSDDKRRVAVQAFKDGVQYAQSNISEEEIRIILTNYEVLKSHEGGSEGIGNNEGNKAYLELKAKQVHGIILKLKR